MQEEEYAAPHSWLTTRQQLGVEAGRHGQGVSLALITGYRPEPPSDWFRLGACLPVS